jgi:hypothetical protein
MKEKVLKEIVNKTVRKIIFESIDLKNFEYQGNQLSVKSFDMSDKEDNAYIKSNVDVIWNILQEGYKKIGGFKGFASRSDMLKKSPFFKLGFCNDELVTVTVYNGYLGGNKCVGATCAKNDRHDAGVELLKFIIEHNVINWDKWVWIEASGRIEELCKEAKAFNVPADYAAIYLKNIPYKKIDEYHYSRYISGTQEIKTIFGFKDQDSFNIFEEEIESKINEFLDNIKKKTKLSENKAQSAYQRYIEKQHPIYKYKDIIDYFVYLKDDEEYNEFPLNSLSILRNAITNVKNMLNDKTLSEKEQKYLQIAIEEGNRVINTSTTLSPLVV